MKSLLPKDIPLFLERFCNFEDGEIKTLQIISPSEIKLHIATQDGSRGFDWVVVEFEFKDIKDASLIDDSKLGFVDMSGGVDIKHNGTQFAFSIVESTFYISCTQIKYQEHTFEG